MKSLLNVKLKSKLLIHKNVLIISANVLISVAVVFSIIVYYNKDTSGLVYEDNATLGSLPGVDLEQRKEELQNQLDDSMIAFSVNTNPVFKDGTSEGNIMIENPEHNNKLLMVEIYLSEDNQLIYKSNALKPNTYIENIKLDKVLPKGEHGAYVYFNAYNIDSEEFTGQAGAEIKIVVLA